MRTISNYLPAISGIRPWIALLIVAQCFSARAADPEAGEEEKQQIERWMILYAEIAAEYKVTAIDPDQAELQLHPSPLLKYTNPVRERQQHGALFVWTRKGRPEVAGTLWSKVLPDPSRRRIATEFHSLSTEPIVASYRGEDTWHPRKAGVEFGLIPKAGLPANSAERRLTQMRALARKFVAEADDDQSRQLRLLPSPLFRYGGSDMEVLDGGLFTFVMGTDPELILSIEALPTSDGHRWHFAAARFTNAALELRHGSTTVWSCPTVNPTDRGGSYFYNPQVAVRNSRIE